MTLEQKAKAYDEAIERAKEELGSGCFNKGSIEYIFPELKESEDEKSKKWILEYFYDGLRKSDEQFKEQFKTAIAWLEKQVSPQMVADAYLRGCNDTEKKWLESKRYTKMDVDNAYLEGIANAKREFEKQGKQEWTDEDESICKDLISYFNYQPLKHSDDLVCNWIKSLKQRLQ